MDKAPTFVGLDVAKRRLDGHLRPSGESFAIDYGDEEVTALIERLVALEPTLVVLEATGRMEVRLAAALAAAGLPVAVVNPRQVRSFARAMSRLAKTTAWMPRRSLISPSRSGHRCVPCRTRRPVIWVPWWHARRQWGGGLEMLVGERNRRQAAGAALRKRIDAHLSWLKEALAEIEHDLGGAARDSPIWRAKEELLRSVPGVGPVSARTLLAELPSSAPSPVVRLPLWSEWHHSAATAARCGADGRSGVAGRSSGLPLYGCRRGCPGQ